MSKVTNALNETILHLAEVASRRAAGYGKRRRWSVHRSKTCVNRQIIRMVINERGNFYVTVYPYDGQLVLSWTEERPEYKGVPVDIYGTNYKRCRTVTLEHPLGDPSLGSWIAEQLRRIWAVKK